jgi:hypothetical protein
MAEGRHPKDGELHPPAKNNHFNGFDAAMQDALNEWSNDATQDQVVRVTFAVKATKNPGGVKEYHVTIAP